MPKASTTRRKKKAQRNTSQTQKFFNQKADEGTVVVCACCGEKGVDHKYAIDGDVDGPETFRSLIASLWKGRYDNLTKKELRGVRETGESPPVTSDPLSVLKTLKLAHKHMGNVPNANMAEKFEPMDGFELGKLDEVAEEYDELCMEYLDEEESRMSGMAELIGKVASAVGASSDETGLSKDRLANHLDLHNLSIQSAISAPALSCLRQVLLFNIEKRFGCVEESYQRLYLDDGKGCGEDVGASVSPSYRQKWNDPFKPAETKSKRRKEKQKKTIRPVKALAAVQSCCELVVKEMHEIQEILSKIEEPVPMPTLPPSFTYAHVPVPEDIPDHVRQYFFDGEYAYEQVLVLQKEAADQLLNVRSAFVAWYAAGQEIWDTGMKHIHEMPLFREYEYTRVSFHAMIAIAAWQEVKIVEFYKSEGAPKLPRAIKEVLRLEKMSLEEFKQDWEWRLLRLQMIFPSVEKMLKTTPKADTSKAEWWKWLIEDTS